MKKINQKQRLRDFIRSLPRGGIARLAEHVGVSPVSVHSWLDETKGWMTRNNEKKVEEFIKQAQESAQPARAVSATRQTIHTKEAPPALDRPSVSAAPAYISLSEALKDLFTRAPEWEIPMTEHIHLILETVSRQNTDETSKKR